MRLIRTGPALLPAALCGLLTLLLAAPDADAVPELYTIDPAQSSVTIAPGSALNLDLGSPLGLRVMDFVSQVGNVAGVSGNNLPGIGVSDGLTSSALGQLLVDYNPLLQTIQFQNTGSFVVFGQSGSWAPGDGSGGPPGSAQAGVYFEDAALSVTGTAALRNAAFNFNTVPSTVTPQGGGVSTFPTFQSVQMLSGFVDYDTNLFGGDGTALLLAAGFTGFQDPGTLEDLGNGIRRITVPFEISAVIGQSQIAGGLPMNITLNLTGQLVATNEVIPEPALAVLVGVGLVGLGALGRQRQGASR